MGRVGLGRGRHKYFKYEPHEVVSHFKGFVKKRRTEKRELLVFISTLYEMLPHQKNKFPYFERLLFWTKLT